MSNESVSPIHSQCYRKGLFCLEIEGWEGENQMKFYKKMLAFIFALTFAFGSVTSVNAATYDFDAPTSPMSVDDNIITASVHRAASVLPEILGLNTVSGFSMINGTMPTSLEEAKTKLMLGAFGTNMNQSPDPYYYNYFYNFYAEANGLVTSEDAVIIPENNVAASPVAADTTIIDAYGTSISLAGRPDILIGVSASNSGTDLAGYDSLISDIRTGAIGEEYYQEGDEDYDPYLVGYTTTTTYDMVKTLNEVAEIMDSITAETGMTGRYNTDGSSATEISKAFADYVAGIPTYVLSQISKLKKVAILTAVNDDGTYTVAGSASQSMTSNNRIVEYCALITENLNDSTSDTSMSASDLVNADVIIYNGMSSSNLDALMDAIDDAGGNSDSMIFITDIPDTVYGMTMNSIENGMGFAYYAGCIYGEELGTTPAELCAYFYEQFYHVNSGDLQDVVSATFADVDSEYSTSLTNYNTSDVKSWIETGRAYYVANYDQFSETALTYVWASDGTTSIDDGISDTYDTSNDTVKETSTATFTYDSTKSIEDSITISGTTSTSTYTYYQYVDGEWVVLSQEPTEAGTYKVKVYAYADDNNTSLTAEFEYEIAETSVLEELVTTVTDFNNDEGTYTEESYSALQEAIEAANTVLNDSDATQEEVDAALSNLQAAYDALVEATSTTDPDESQNTDISDLTTLVEELSVLSDNSIKNYFNSVSSYADLAETINAANNVLNDENATQEEIDEAVATLESAFATFAKEVESANLDSDVVAAVEAVEDVLAGESSDDLETAVSNLQAVVETTSTTDTAGTDSSTTDTSDTSDTTSTDSTSSSPKTGDNANVAAWVGVAFVSAIGVGYYYNKKRQHS